MNEMNIANPECISHVEHSFFITDLTPLSVCDYCNSFIWGLKKSGFLCSVCDYCSHINCVHLVSANCSLKSPLAQTISHPSTSHGIKYNHNWREAELKFSAQCAVCEGSILLDEIIGCECSRCNLPIHMACQEKIAIDSCIPTHKNLLLLPYIDLPDDTDSPSKLPRNPLIVFVNSRSGGQEGTDLVKILSHQLTPEQVFDLDCCGGPRPPLEKFKNVKGLRILVCGGDGTVGWVISFFGEIAFPSMPPVAILPLGTGNDLARTLNWGSGYSGEGLEMLLVNIEQATPRLFDVWSIRMWEGNDRDTPRQRNFIMNNYTSFGIDAKVVLDFHTFRKENPDLHFNQYVNKFWYGMWGGTSILLDSIEPLESYMTIEVDGKVIEIPGEAEGLIILNVPYYAGGCDIWGPIHEPDANFQNPTTFDSKLELVVITGQFHMATITMDLTSAIRLAQGGSIKLNITTTKPLPFHVDGEPMLLERSCSVIIDLKHQVKMLHNNKTF
jgi:diacylglycerol kinase (ATP)